MPQSERYHGAIDACFRHGAEGLFDPSAPARQALKLKNHSGTQRGHQQQEHGSDAYT